MAIELAAAPAHLVDPPEALLAAVGRRPREAWRSDRWMLVYGHEDDVAGIAPDFHALALAEPGEVVVTAAAGSGFDFVCRCFEPALGVDWAERTGRTRLRRVTISGAVSTYLEGVIEVGED